MRIDPVLVQGTQVGQLSTVVSFDVQVRKRSEDRTTAAAAQVPGRIVMDENLSGNVRMDQRMKISYFMNASLKFRSESGCFMFSLIETP
jgi:hypothetical protein